MARGHPARRPPSLPPCLKHADPPARSLALPHTLPPPPPPAPLLHRRGLPLQWGESEISAVFGQFGVLTSLRLVRHSLTKHSLG